jgi:hypothetical protein
VVARALDAAGHELVRTEEWVNLPHPLSKAEIVLEEGKGGPPKAAKVVWAHLKGEKPRSVTLAFDGLPVPLDADGCGALPAHSLSSIHVLTAQVEFTPLESVHRDVAYGGEYGSEVSTELTGVPVRARSLPPVDKLGGWFTSDGKPLSVAAVENGPGELYVVRVPESWDFKRKTERASSLQFEMRLGKEDQVRFVSPIPQRVAGSGEVSDLFEVSPALEYRLGGLPWLLAHVVTSGAGSVQRPRIADAVAVAGQQAMAQNRRRAVLLILAGDEKDASDHDPAMVRRYLEALRVPLIVWTLSKPAPGSIAAAWGLGEDVSEVRAPYRAVETLREQLESQRIVMVDGRLLPQSIALSPQASGVELVGGPP